MRACGSSIQPARLRTTSLLQEVHKRPCTIRRLQASSQQSASSRALEPLVKVSVNTTSSEVARATLLRLQQLGELEIWATSAANHFTAVAGLGMAAQELQQQPLPLQAPPAAAAAAGAAAQDMQQQQLEGLAVSAVMAAHDQPTKDPQKRRLNKLELYVQPARSLDPASPAAAAAAGQPGSRISTNRTTKISDILGLMQQQLLAPDTDSSSGSSSSRVQLGTLCVVEARGEQAVTRALKAALSLQAAAGTTLLLRPIAGKVVDVVAEKQGQSRLADGLLLVFTWA